MRTYTPKPDEVQRTWHVIDADGRALGRVATECATLLRGKHKPSFSYHVDVGDHVIVINAARIAVTPEKAAQKKYRRHSGYPGGLTETTLAQEMARRPEEVVRRAVRGMLPKNRLGRKVLKKLKVYAGPDHPHAAQVNGTPGEPNSRRAERDAKAKDRRAAKMAADEATKATETGSSAEVDETPEEVIATEAIVDQGVPSPVAESAEDAGSPEAGVSGDDDVPATDADTASDE